MGLNMQEKQAVTWECPMRHLGRNVILKVNSLSTFFGGFLGSCFLVIHAWPFCFKRGLTRISPVLLSALIKGIVKPVAVPEGKPHP